MTTVVDASVLIAALTAAGGVGAWSRGELAEGPLLAPHLLPVEVAHGLRRLAHTGDISDDAATLAHADFTRLPVRLLPYEPFADRVWELRATVTPYDAWYVAAAEALDLPLATLDGRLSRASGPHCRFVTPPGV